MQLNSPSIDLTSDGSDYDCDAGSIEDESAENDTEPYDAE